MVEVEVGEPEPISPHNQALYEAGKSMLIDSVSVGRDFCKFMVGVSTGAIPLYLALLQITLPADYRPDWWRGVVAILPGGVFLIAAGIFALGLFPKASTFSLDVVEAIEDARAKTIGRRARFSKIGFAVFSTAVLVSIVVTVAALRVKAPATPTKPFEVKLIP